MNIRYSLNNFFFLIFTFFFFFFLSFLHQKFWVSITWESVRISEKAIDCFRRLSNIERKIYISFNPSRILEVSQWLSLSVGPSIERRFWKQVISLAWKGDNWWKYKYKILRLYHLKRRRRKIWFIWHQR